MFLLPPIAVQSKTSEVAAQGVLERFIGSSAKKFHFNLVSKSGEEDSARVSASGGEVLVEGSSTVAMCRAAYEYLKDSCHCQISWSGDNPKIPSKLPDAPLHTIQSVGKYHHYFNVCTFGYTTVWWDWKRWRHEIDWMALHGINMPLAMNGQEKIWQKVFRSLGVSDESIGNFFTGAAFLPWHRMGNLDKHMGPLTQNWIDSQAELQKKILSGERELGMTPVVPGFSGFVPADFEKVMPGVRLQSPSAWAGFAPTKFVDALNPLFVKLGSQFIKEYNHEFGSDHLYLCDTFNEMTPQFPASSELSDLAATGKAVYDSIHAADPDGVWVMQGWLFYNDRGYWKPERTAAMLGGVPKGKLIVLDLASNEHEVWREQPAVRDDGWIFNTLHNYGQTTNLYGDLQHYSDVANRALLDPNHGVMLGMGLTPEGIDQNPVVYELMTDLMWRRDHVDVKEWLRGYAASRYGSASPDIVEAWNLLLKSVYGPNGGSKDSWRNRPSLSADIPSFDVESVRTASELLAKSPQLRSNTLYRRDLVDVSKTWLGALADVYLAIALATFDDDKSKYSEFRDKFFEVLHDLDRLMATRPEHRLTTWIDDARRNGKSLKEKDWLEQNARMQVTVWGGPELYDYANKEWAGLNEDFMAQRWRLLFSALEKAGSTTRFTPPDFGKWELNWAMSTKPVRESKPEDSWVVANQLIEKYRSATFDPESLLNMGEDPGIAVGKSVSDSGGTEGDHRPELAVDGKVFGGYWSASPAPQWLQIDLGAEHQVDGVWLFPYYGDGRYYQYKIEVSTNAQDWNVVVDKSGNEKVSTFRGYREKFAPTPARYVRITMLKNSANQGVHLYEARVYETK